MKRLGTPEEVAYAHLFLASDESRYITGQSIIVDGGQSCQRLTLMNIDRGRNTLAWVPES